MTTVLYVEDDDNNAFMLTQRLKRHDIKVVRVDDGEKALMSAAWNRPDAVLLDINLPGIDGLTVLRRLRADKGTRSLPVIVVSASVMGDAQEKAHAAGADAFISKPIDLTLLLQALSAVLPPGQERGP